MITVREMKPGDSLEWLITYEIEGVAQNLTGCVMTSQVRTKRGTLCWTNTIALTVDPTVAKLSAAGSDTENSETGELLCDIVYQWLDGSIETSPTFVIDMQPEVTQ